MKKREPVFRPEPPTKSIRNPGVPKSSRLVADLTDPPNEVMDKLVGYVASDRKLDESGRDFLKESLLHHIRSSIGGVQHSLWMVRLASQEDRVALVREFLGGLENQAEIARHWSDAPFRVDPHGIIDSDLVRAFAASSIALRDEIAAKLEYLEMDEHLHERESHVVERFVHTVNFFFRGYGGDTASQACALFVIEIGKLFEIELTDDEVRKILRTEPRYGF